MSESDGTRPAALIVAAAFVFGFGMFTIAFGVTFDSLVAVGFGTVQVGTAVGAVRRERKLTSPNSEPLSGGAA